MTFHAKSLLWPLEIIATLCFVAWALVTAIFEAIVNPDGNEDA